MNNDFNNKYTSDKYLWNDAMILDKIQEILQEKDLNDLDLTEEDLCSIKTQLNDSLSLEEMNESACLIAVI